MFGKKLRKIVLSGNFQELTHIEIKESLENKGYRVKLEELGGDTIFAKYKGNVYLGIGAIKRHFLSE